MKLSRLFMYVVGKGDDILNYPYAIRKIYKAMENLNNRPIVYINVLDAISDCSWFAGRLSDAIQEMFTNDRIYDCAVISSVVERDTENGHKDAKRYKEFLKNAGFESIENYMKTGLPDNEDEEMFLYTDNSIGKYIYNNINHYLLKESNND